MRRWTALAAALSAVATLAAQERPIRKPLGSDERAAVLALFKAVDLAQDTDVVSSIDMQWRADVLKSIQLAYVPFRLGLASWPDASKSTAMYVRVVSRHDGRRSTEESSSLREWVTHGGAPPPRPGETMALGPGELPIGGPASMSSRQPIAAAAQASALLALQQKQLEKEKAAAEADRQRREAPKRDPYRFPFEEYYFFDARSPHVERALAVPPGEYDVFIGLVDRARVKTTTPVVIHRTIAVPDFWNAELRLSDLMLVGDVRTLPAPLKPQDQMEHPYTWGRAEVIPASGTSFSHDDVLSVVYQICNYGAPDTDIVADYNFYWKIDGEWKLFNHTQPQELDNRDLPPLTGWETQGFAMQQVPLASFTPGDYKLEIIVRDRMTRQTARQSTTFMVK
jgi:hypothetical protein